MAITKYARISRANRAAGRRAAWLGSVPISLTTFAPILYTLVIDDTLLLSEANNAGGPYRGQVVSDSLVLSDKSSPDKATTLDDTYDIITDLILLRRNGCLIVQLDPYDDLLFITDDMRLAYQSRILADDFSAIMDTPGVSLVAHLPVVTGITQDGHVVFDDLFDDIGRIVVVAATGFSVGFMSDGTPYFLTIHGLSLTSTFDDSLLLSDGLLKLQQPTMLDNIFMLADTVVKARESSMPDAILFTDEFIKQRAAAFDDSALLTDEATKGLAQIIVDLLHLADLAALDKLQLTDNLLFNEQLENSVTRWLADLVDFTDTVLLLKFQFGLDLIDNTINFSDSFRANLAAIIADDSAFVDEPIKAVLTSILENASLTDALGAGKFIPRDVADALTFITDTIAKLQSTGYDDNAGFADTFLLVANTVMALADNQDFIDEMVKSMTTRLEERMELADEVSAGKLIPIVLSDDIGWRDEMVKLLGLRFGDEFGTVEELEKLLVMMVLEEGLYIDEIEPMITLWKPFFYAYLDNIEVGTTSKR